MLSSLSAQNSIIRRLSLVSRHLTSATMATPQRGLENPALFVCDLQEKFKPAIYEYAKVIGTAQKMLRASQILDFPVYVTTQSRARLGDTDNDLKIDATEGVKSACHEDKTLFSMWTPEVQAAVTKTLGSSSKKLSAVVVGIETHICVTQTTLDLLREGHKVYVLADGVSSCNKEEIPIALARLRAEGAVITTSESWLYELMGDAKIPEFREMVKLVKETKQTTQEALAALSRN